MEPWRTAIVDAGPAHLRVRGHDVLQLMQRSTFTDLIFLLHHERIPSPGERRVLDYAGRSPEGRRACSLYLSLMNRMNVPMTRFGDADRPLAEL